MTDLKDYKKVYERLEQVKTELDTPFGKLTLQMIDKNRARIRTEQDIFLTVNKVEYRFDSHFHREGILWKRDLYQGRPLSRRYRDSSGGISATNSAWDEIGNKLVPLLCSLLNQSPEMSNAAEKIKMNNDICDLQDRRDYLLQDVKEIEDKIEGFEQSMLGNQE